ncbi:MAG: hypothetical protein ABIH52_03435 [Candidatus Aenigmatarchaeota archaeon]|nr:hypothetical protein [Nanoarchaeota archaeon]
MTRILAYVTGIYPYSRNHSLAARKWGRKAITREELFQIKEADSQRFVAKQTELGLDYISDGQFMWMDYARPFALSNKDVEEENLEMMRKSDTNTFIRRPKLDRLEDLANTDLSKFMMLDVEKRSLKVYGPYTFANLAVTKDRLEDVMSSYSQALANSLKGVKASLIEIAEPMLTEKTPEKDVIEHLKSCIGTITNRLDAETNLSAPFNPIRHVWKDLLEFPVKGITVDMRARDYFNIIPEAEKIVEDHIFMFGYDIQKTLVLGCVNGRNGGFTPDKGLETGEWIVDVVNLVRDKTETQLGVTFSTDEVIVPRAVADKKLEAIARAKRLLGGLT